MSSRSLKSAALGWSRLVHLISELLRTPRRVTEDHRRRTSVPSPPKPLVPMEQPLLPPVLPSQLLWSLGESHPCPTSQSLSTFQRGVPQARGCSLGPQRPPNARTLAVKAGRSGCMVWTVLSLRPKRAPTSLWLPLQPLLSPLSSVVPCQHLPAVQKSFLKSALNPSCCRARLLSSDRLGHSF